MIETRTEPRVEVSPVHAFKVLTALAVLSLLGAVAAYTPLQQQAARLLTPLSLRLGLTLIVSISFFVYVNTTLAPRMFSYLRHDRALPVRDVAVVRKILDYIAVTLLPLLLFVALSLLAFGELTMGRLLGLVITAACVVPVVWYGARWLDLFLTKHPEDILRGMLRGSEVHDDEEFRQLIAEARQRLEAPGIDPLEYRVRLPRMRLLEADLKAAAAGTLDPHGEAKEAASRTTLADLQRRTEEEKARLRLGRLSPEDQVLRARLELSEESYRHKTRKLTEDDDGAAATSRRLVREVMREAKTRTGATRLLQRRLDELKESMQLDSVTVAEVSQDASDRLEELLEQEEKESRS